MTYCNVPFREKLCRRSVVHLVCFAALLVLAAVFCTACSTTTEEEAPEKMVSFTKEVFKDNKKIVDVRRKDTDGDDFLEWVVFYRFDQVGEHGPVAALIYDVVPDPATQLPIVYPYRLRTPAQSYLSQGLPRLELIDIVPETDGVLREELVFTTTVELACFQIDASVINQPKDDPPLYRCIGFFRGERVDFDPAKGLTVTVTKREGYERSDLVTKYFYKPEPGADGYFVTGTDILVPPFESAVDFPAGMPQGILDTPYPEKIVLAFYKALTRTDLNPADYLSTQAASEFAQGRLKYGWSFPLSQLKFAIVKELSYFPTQEDSPSTMVIVKVVFQPVSGQKTLPIEVRWVLIRDQNRRWKMDHTEP